MASFTLANPQVFPNGTSVGAYPKSRWTPRGPSAGTAPLGSAVNSQTMTSGTLTFTGLTTGTEYWASDSSGTRYVGFTVGEDLSKVDDVSVDTDGTLAANSDTRLASQKAVKTYADSISSGGGLADGAVTSAKIADAAIVNADVNASAAIAGTKINPEPAAKSTLTAKGSLYAATAASTPADLPVGTNGQILMANSAQSTGLQWTPMFELGYAEATANQTNATTTLADVTGVTTTVTVGIRPILIRAVVPAISNGTANGGVNVAILEDGTIIGSGGSLINIASASTAFERSVRRAPSAGSHTYKLQFKSIVVGTSTLTADNYTLSGPMFIQVVQI